MLKKKQSDLLAEITKRVLEVKKGSLLLELACSVGSFWDSVFLVCGL
jgi:hypothetical protein